MEQNILHKIYYEWYFFFPDDYNKEKWKEGDYLPD